jgi:signal peptidase I
MDTSKTMIRDMVRARDLLKRSTPVDTGFLKHHATFGRLKVDGFDLIVSKSIANYVKIVQEGRGYNQNNRNYIGLAETIINRMLARSYALGKDDSNKYDALHRDIERNKKQTKTNRVKKMEIVNRKRGYVGK